MTTVVLAPPAPTATVVSSPTATGSSSNTNNNTVAADVQRGANSDSESSELEPEPEEKENEERSSNNHNSGVVDCRSEMRAVDCGTAASAAISTKTAAPTNKPASATEMRYKKRPRVSFESADIVEFEPTLYTTTVTSGGIPVGMSFTERSRSRRRLDSWELERTEVRVGRQSYMEEGYLDPTERESILNKTGYDDSTMVVVEAEVNRIIADRRESNEVDFEFMYGLGEVDESVEEDDEVDEVDEVDGEGDEAEEDADGDDTEAMDADESAHKPALADSSSGFSSEEENEDDRTLP